MQKCFLNVCGVTRKIIINTSKVNFYYIHLLYDLQSLMLMNFVGEELRKNV